MPAPTVALYARTSILTDKYDRYEKDLLLYCKQQGWGNVKYYRDRAGGTVDEAELQRLAQSFGDLLGGKGSQADAADIVQRLSEMSATDARHDRDGLRQLQADVAAGAVQVVLVHDLSQLGKNKMAAWGVLSALMQAVEVHMPGVGRIRSDTRLPSGSKEDYF